MARKYKHTVVTANGVWKEFETLLNARLKQATSKEKWWANKVQAGDSSQAYANKAMTKMQAEAADTKVVFIDWSAHESISHDTKEEGPYLVQWVRSLVHYQ